MTSNSIQASSLFGLEYFGTARAAHTRLQRRTHRDCQQQRNAATSGRVSPWSPRPVTASLFRTAGTR